ncbi:MAG: hypothetical protein ACHQE5_00650 [Actinomycetes bacterium]
MDTTDKASVLADRLAYLLPASQNNAQDHLVHIPTERRRYALWLGNHDADMPAAVEQELRDLLAANPGLQDLVAKGDGPRERAALTRALTEALDADTGVHCRDMLWRLLVGEDSAPDAQKVLPPKQTRFRQARRAAGDGWLARKTAVLWMNVLIAVPMITVYVAAPRPNPLLDGFDGSAVALKVFTIWTLSFLPGWLYVRFLGQRAGALWSEYVLNLHRLGLDRPEFLPCPPKNSEYFEEWIAGRGYLHSEQNNIYRLKFNAFYGRSVSAASELRTNFSVTAETMFPVFLISIILSAGFTALFWQTAFADDPTSVGDMVKFGFLGAYVFIAQSLTRRFFASDLRPSAYASAILRIVVVLITVIALHQILGPAGQPNVEAVVAFVVGIFPIIAFQALYRTAAAALRVAVPQLTPDYPLNQLDGLNIWYETRLVEEGIEDMENLATANLVDVILHTRVPVGRLVDWVDQAHLYLHLDRIERGRSERRTARQAPSEQPSPDAKPAGHESRVHGSVVAGSRAGTRTRVALRQLGVRNATDLLKAFPPDQIDPRVGSPALSSHFSRLEAAGIDEDQVRVLVRVLDEDTGLAPVWNWQTRGSVARADLRRPRSQVLPAPRRQPASAQPAGT